MMELGPYGKYEGTFPREFIRREESLLLEWRPSKALLGKGHPLLAFLMFPGAFTIPFALLLPILAFLGILGFMLRYFYQIGSVLVLLAVLIVYGSGAIAWWKTFFCLTDKAVYIRTGIIFKRTYRTLFSDIVDVKVERSLFERITGRGTVVFMTPGGRFRRYRKVKWYTINDPDIISSSLRKLIFHHKKARFDDDTLS